MVKTKIFNFSKPLDNLTTLFLDNGAASLAASIIQDGHEVVIEDYSNLEMMTYFEPPKGIGDSLEAIGNEVMGQLSKGQAPSQQKLQELKAKGAELKEFQKERIEELARKDAELACASGLDAALFKVWNGLGTYYFIKASEEMKKLGKKEGKRIYVFGGGPQVGWFNQHLLKIAPAADALLFGEGEIEIKNMLRAIEGKQKLHEISGLIYRSGDKIIMNPPNWIQNLDVLPNPEYDPKVYLNNIPDRKIQFIMLDESRGCPNKCNFCNHYIESGDKWRSRSPQAIVDHIEELIKKYGTRYFRYSGSSTPPQLRRKIAEEIINRRLDIRYTTFMNINTVKADDMAVMKESGCFGIFFGLESANDGILQQSIGIKNSKEAIKYAIQSAKKAGIYTVGSLIIPSPYDTPETIKETLDFVISLGIDAAPVLPPGLTGSETVWAKYPERFGIETEPDWINKMLFWDVNLNIPVVVWDPLPYKVNGRNFLEYSKITGQAARTLQAAGIPQVSDEMAFMAKIYGQDPSDFIFETGLDLKHSNYERMKERVLKINDKFKNGPLVKK